MNKYFIVIICLIFIFCAVSITGKIFTLDELPVNFMATFLGAIITAVITSLLLKQQSKVEEEKNINIKLFDKKSLLFDDFNTKLLNIMMNKKISEDDYNKLKSNFYFKLMFFLEEKSRNLIISYLANLANCIEISLDTENYDLKQVNKNIEDLEEIIYRINIVLYEDLNFGKKINVPSLKSQSNYTNLPLSFMEYLLKEINKVFSNEKIFNKAKYMVMANGTFLVLELNGKYTPGGGIHIGPFFNKTANEKFPAYDGIYFRFFLPLLNPVSELYSVNDGTNYNKPLTDFIGSKNGLINLQNKLKPQDLKMIAIDDNIYNQELKIVRFDDINTIKDYSEVYIEVVKTIATRSYFYFKNAKTKKDNLTIKELYEKFESITDKQYFEHVIKTLSTSIDFGK